MFGVNIQPKRHGWRHTESVYFTQLSFLFSCWNSKTNLFAIWNFKVTVRSNYRRHLSVIFGTKPKKHSKENPDFTHCFYSRMTSTAVTVYLFINIKNSQSILGRCKKRRPVVWMTKLLATLKYSMNDKTITDIFRTRL